MSTPPASECELCREDGGTVVLRDDDLRIVLVDEPDYPGFVRVIWNAHVREMSDLAPPQAERLLRAVRVVETAQRAVLAPLKVNLASLGNMTPHLHWHVIPRFADDAHFPLPIWGERRRETGRVVLEARRARLPALVEHIRRTLSAH